MTTSIDQAVQGLFAKLDQRKKRVSSLKTLTSKSWKTTGSFRLIGASTPANIQTASVEAVEQIAQHVCLMELASQTASQRLETTVAPAIQGYAPELWFEDLRKRLAMINIREEETQLAAVEARLNQVLSPEERRRIEVELLTQELAE